MQNKKKVAKKWKKVEKSGKFTKKVEKKWKSGKVEKSGKKWLAGHPEFGESPSIKASHQPS